MPKQTKSTPFVAVPRIRGYQNGMFTPDQLRAARAMLNWSQDDLAGKAGVAAMVIKNFERSLSDPRLSSLLKLQAALTDAGIEFTDATATHGPGVRWATVQARPPAQDTAE